MNVVLNRLELLSAANDADKIAPSSSPLEILKGVLLEADAGMLTLTAGNLEIALERRIKADVRETGSVVFNARMFASMVGLLAGDTVSLVTGENGQLVIAAGTAQYTVPAFPSKDYPKPDIPFPEDTVVVTGIPAMAKRTVFAVSDNEARPLLKCVNLVFTSEGLKAVGCDGFRIAAAKGESKSSASVSLLIPASSLEKLARLVTNKDELRVGTTGKSIVFTKEDFIFSARLMEGDYMDTDKLLSSVQPAFTILTDAESMREAVSAVTTMADEHSRLMLRFDGGHIKLWCGSQLGSSSGELDVVPLSGAPSGEYWYNPRQLYECLRAQNGTLMVDVAQNGFLMLHTDELICMQLPTRPPAPSAENAKGSKQKNERIKEAA